VFLAQVWSLIAADEPHNLKIISIKPKTKQTKKVIFDATEGRQKNHCGH
jgi:hypothetical protein